MNNIFNIYFCSSKRTVDFGLGRGLSGAIEAKHRLGMAAANFAGTLLNVTFLLFCNKNDSIDKFSLFVCVILNRWSRTSATIWKCRLNSSIQLQTLYKATPNRFHELKKYLKNKKEKNQKNGTLSNQVALIFKPNIYYFIRSKFSISNKKQLSSFWKLQASLQFLLELNDEIEGWLDI